MSQADGSSYHWNNSKYSSVPSCRWAIASWEIRSHARRVGKIFSPFSFRSFPLSRRHRCFLSSRRYRVDLFFLVDLVRTSSTLTDQGFSLSLSLSSRTLSDVFSGLSSSAWNSSSTSRSTEQRRSSSVALLSRQWHSWAYSRRSDVVGHVVLDGIALRSG